MFKQKGFTVLELLYTTVIVLSLAAYFVNAYKFTQCDFQASYRC